MAKEYYVSWKKSENIYEQGHVGFRKGTIPEIKKAVKRELGIAGSHLRFEEYVEGRLK